MQKRAFLLKVVTLALITLLVAQVYAASALPHQENQEAPESGRFLQFGQSLALADSMAIIALFSLQLTRYATGVNSECSSSVQLIWFDLANLFVTARMTPKRQAAVKQLL